MPDILDRTDRSLAPVPHHARPAAPTMVSKRTKYDWSQGSKPGRFAYVPKGELHIDDTYQREQISEHKVRAIASKWDWALIGALAVAERDDGSLWVFDGGHRTRAAFYRDDVSALPCMIYRFADISDEAKAYLGCNLMLTAVSSIDKYKAAVCAEEDIAIATKRLLSEFGVDVTKHATSAGQIKCINTLQRCVERDAALARRCFGMILEISEGHVVSAACLRGLFALCSHFAPHFDVLGRYGDKLSRFSQREIETRIRQMKVECGKGGEKIEALGILDLINKGRRNKLRW